MSQDRGRPGFLRPPARARRGANGSWRLASSAVRDGRRSAAAERECRETVEGVAKFDYAGGVRPRGVADAADGRVASRGSVQEPPIAPRRPPAPRRPRSRRQIVLHKSSGAALAAANHGDRVCLVPPPPSPSRFVLVHADGFDREGLGGGVGGGAEGATSGLRQISIGKHVS